MVSRWVLSVIVPLCIIARWASLRVIDLSVICARSNWRLAFKRCVNFWASCLSHEVRVWMHLLSSAWTLSCSSSWRATRRLSCRAWLVHALLTSLQWCCHHLNVVWHLGGVSSLSLTCVQLLLLCMLRQSNLLFFEHLSLIWMLYRGWSLVCWWSIRRLQRHCNLLLLDVSRVKVELINMIWISLCCHRVIHHLDELIVCILTLALGFWWYLDALLALTFAGLVRRWISATCTLWVLSGLSLRSWRSALVFNSLLLFVSCFSALFLFVWIVLSMVLKLRSIFVNEVVVLNLILLEDLF